MVASDVGQKGGAVKPGALAHGRQNGWRRVRGQGGGVLWQAYGRAQVALVGGDGGIEGWRDERGWFVRGDNERLGTRPALEFGFSILVQPWIGFLILGKSQFKENFI